MGRGQTPNDETTLSRRHGTPGAGDLTESTPVEIDTVLAELWSKRQQLALRIAEDRKRLEVIDAGKARPREASRLEEIKQRLGRNEASAHELQEQIDVYQAEFERRGGWHRYYLVVGEGSGIGHVHRSMYCTTCYPTTQYSWLIDLADCDEKAMVEEFGEKACSVCFPDAPSMYAEMKAKGLTSKVEQRDQAAREQAAEEKRKRAQEKEAKAIANPDGTPLRTRRYGVIKTLRTAKIELVDTIVWILQVESRSQGNQNTFLDEYRRDREAIAAAVAHKEGRELADVLAEAEAKAQKKL